jgi:hypothetical protein
MYLLPLGVTAKGRKNLHVEFRTDSWLGRCAVEDETMVFRSNWLTQEPKLSLRPVSEPSYQRLSDRFFWHRTSEDIRNFVKGCVFGGFSLKIMGHALASLGAASARAIQFQWLEKHRQDRLFFAWPRGKGEEWFSRQQKELKLQVMVKREESTRRVEVGDEGWRQEGRHMLNQKKTCTNVYCTTELLFHWSA